MALLIIGGGLLGCNAFGGIDQAPNTVSELQAEAEIAMTKGEPGRAVTLLETAFAKDSSRVDVRVGLSEALFAAHGLDPFTFSSALDQLGGVSSSKGPTRERRQFCNREAHKPSSYRVVPLGEQALGVLSDRTTLVQRIRTLLVTGVFRDRPTGLDRAETETRQTAYLIAALTRVAREVTDVHAVTQNAGSALFRDRASPSVDYVVCGASEEAIRQTVGQLCRLRQGFRQAVSWLRVRNTLVGSEQTSMLIESLEAQISALSGRGACGGDGRDASARTSSQQINPST